MLFLLTVPLSMLLVSGRTERASENFLIFPPLPFRVVNTSNALCKEQSELYLHSLQNFTLWASEMWDATAKSTTGILRGSMHHFGHFEQCLSARAPFATQYCLVNIKATIPAAYKRSDPFSLWYSPNEGVVEVLYPKHEDLTQERRDILKLGWCVPASCNPKDLQTHLQSFVDDFELPFKTLDISYSAKISQADCQTAEGFEFDRLDVGFCTVTVILVILVIVATFYDDVTDVPLGEQDGAKRHLLLRLLACFSAKNNWNNLVKISGDRNPSLAVVDGIKVLALAVVIFIHTFALGGLLPSAINADARERLSRIALFGLGFYATAAVELLLLTSGILTSYTILRQLSRGKSPIYLFCSRYMRTTPSLAYVVLFYSSILRHLGSGPLWIPLVGQESDDCKKNWWINLLYLNNYVNSKNTCLVQTWFLACIFHYYALSIIICLVLKKWKILGITSILSVIVTSVAVNFSVIYNNSFPPFVIFTSPCLKYGKTYIDTIMAKMFEYEYIPSYTRAAPFFIGTLAGYYYFNELSRKSINIVNKINLNAVFVLSTCLAVASYSSSALFTVPPNKYSITINALFGSLARVGIPLGITGIIYATGKLKSGILYRFLSSHLFEVMSKLGFGAYLVHGVSMYREAGMVQSPQVFSFINLIGRGLLNMVLAYIASLLIYIFVEEPFRRIPQALTSSTSNTIDANGGDRTDAGRTAKMYKCS